VPGVYVAPRVLDMGWMDRANCLGCDPELFYPERGESISQARAVCAGCVVRVECLDFALAIGEKVGIWGGLSERERRRLRKARRQGASA
jgi:WhiB family redox-sensing transcriptional regulator